MLSIVIPTLNSEKTLTECLTAVLAQQVPREQYEIIIADGGSIDKTLEIARSFGVNQIVENTLRTGEAGKSAGISASTKEFILLLDSDNILPDSSWLTSMLAPFADDKIIASEPLAYQVRKEDPALIRYFSLLGMSDPLCLFTGNYDRLSLITNKWSGMKIAQQEREGYLELTLTSDNLPTMGANGFIFRRSLLAHIQWEPYFFDIDVVHQAVQAGFKHIAKVKVGIIHLYCEKLRDFSRKQQRRIRDFLYFSQEKQRSYPWQQNSLAGIVLFCLATVLIIPLLIQIMVGYIRKPDRAWWYHIPVCWVTLWIYGKAAIGKVLGRQQAPASREAWQR